MKFFTNYLLALVLLFSNVTYAANRIVDADVLRGKAKAGQEFLPNGNAEQLKNPWTCYNDGGSTPARPIDGTGGTTSLASTIVRQSFAGFFGLTTDYAWKYTHPASSVQGQGCSMDFTVNRWSDGASLLQIDIDHTLGSIGFTNGSEGTSPTDSDVIFYIYDKTNNVLIEPDHFKIVDATAQGVKRLTAIFQTSFNATDYRLIFHNATTSTTAFIFNFRASIGKPAPVSNGVIKTAWTAYTPTITGGGTPTQVLFWWQQDGDSINIKGTFRTGTVSTANATFSLPNGMVVDPSKSSGNILGDYHGSAWRNSLSASSRKRFILQTNTGSGNIVYWSNDDYTTPTGAGTALPGNDAWGSSEGQSVFLEHLPILGLSGTTQVSSATPTGPIVASRTTLSSATLTVNVPFNFTTSVFDTHGAFSSGNQFIAPSAGYYRCTLSGLITASGGTNVYARVNGTVDTLITGISSSGRNSGSTVVYASAGQPITFISEGTISLASAGAVYGIIEKVQGGATGVNKTEDVGLEYSQTSAQSIPASVGTTILWNSKIRDTHGMMNTSTGEATVPYNGNYDACVGIELGSATWNAGNTKSIQFYKNGGLVKYLATQVQATFTNQFWLSGCYTYPDVKIGDKLTIFVNANEGGARLLSTTPQGNWFILNKRN